jgi:hypothetical protein
MVADITEQHHSSDLVLRFELPLDLAPTMNVYASMLPWQRARAREAIMTVLSYAARTSPGCLLGIVRGPAKKRGRLGAVVDGGHSRRRHVVVTRYSSRRPDEVSCDTVGGKLPIDCLVRAGVLRDDSAKWCTREARWERVPRGAAGFVEIEVYEEGER